MTDLSRVCLTCKDAHIAIADYDADTALFGVFDGHGGPEVSKYCAQHLPDFIKSLNSYQNNNLKECLEEAFLKFDKTLTQKEVIEELKILAGNPEVDNDNDSDDEINEAILLREEADLPIAEIMKRYGNDAEPGPDPNPECASSSDNKPGLSIPIHLRREVKERAKPCSPYLRAKRSSDYQMKAEDASNGEGSCSSTCSGSNLELEAVSETNQNASETTEPQSDSQTNEVKDELSQDLTQSNERENNLLNGNSELKINGPKEDNNNIIIEGVKPKDDIEGVTDEEKTVTTESNKEVKSDSNEVPYKGKGKYKKLPVMSDKKRKPDSTTDKPIYEYFMEDFEQEDEESDDSEEFQGGDDSSEEELDDPSEEDSDSEEDEDDVDGEDKTTPSFEKPAYDSGCTAVVAILKGDHLVVANAGDSRCVVARDRNAIDMSIDHKPEDDIERERIAKAGGKVTRDGRVNGGLNLSRAIGDHAYKQNEEVSDRDQMITALPDIRTLELNPKSDSFMVIACDGIWYVIRFVISDLIDCLSLH